MTGELQREPARAGEGPCVGEHRVPVRGIRWGFNPNQLLDWDPDPNWEQGLGRYCRGVKGFPP